MDPAAHFATEEELYYAAIATSGYTRATFAQQVLGIDDAAVFADLVAEGRLHPVIRRVCVAILRAPVVAEILAEAGGEPDPSVET